MKVDSKLAKKIESGDFIVTAEYLPCASSDGSMTEAAMKAMGGKALAVNVADNHCGVAMSSLAASAAVLKSGAEPVYQMVTRDSNRISLQSNLLGAAYMGIKNVLCLSGYHQSLMCPQSANVYDIDSTQFIAMATKMAEAGVLADGTKINGQFSMLIGAVANPFMKPLELNMLKLAQKVQAGAKFIQTQAVFDVDGFGKWITAAKSEGITKKAAILAGVLPLESASEAEKLRDKYTDHYIPDEIVKRLKAAGDANAQKKEGVAICVEVIKKLQKMDGVRGIHILSGGKEKAVPEILAAAGL